MEKSQPQPADSSFQAGDRETVETPDWILDVENISERSAIVTVQCDDGSTQRILTSRHSVFDESVRD
jgi:hypothetical protein